MVGAFCLSQREQTQFNLGAKIIFTFNLHARYPNQQTYHSCFYSINTNQLSEVFLLVALFLTHIPHITLLSSRKRHICLLYSVDVILNMFSIFLVYNILSIHLLVHYLLVSLMFHITFLIYQFTINMFTVFSNFLLINILSIHLLVLYLLTSLLFHIYILSSISSL